jgi:hypothetical protein
MIFASGTEYQVGQAVLPISITDEFGVSRPPQPVFIVREATHEEWDRCIRASGGNPDGFSPAPFYYEIHTD